MDVVVFLDLVEEGFDFGHLVLGEFHRRSGDAFEAGLVGADAEVLEELDRSKKGTSEVARNSRQVSRFLDELMSTASKRDIDSGLPLPSSAKQMQEGVAEDGCGHLFFQTQLQPKDLPQTLPGNTPDNNILGTALALADMAPHRDVTLVSKDINLRIKASIIGIHTEDYHNDQVLDDVNLLYSGEAELPADFWETHSKDIDSWQEEGHTYYRIKGPNTNSWYVNQCLYIDGESP